MHKEVIEFQGLDKTVMSQDILKDSSALKIFTRKPRILLIEDSPIIQRVHVGFLEWLECLVDVVDCGEKALQADINNYDLVFMDIGLPDIDGFAVTKKMRAKENETRRLPIIALTAYGDLLMDEAKEAGIDEVLVKPTPPEELEEVLKRWLPCLLR